MRGARKADSRIQTVVDARWLAMGKLYLERKYGEKLNSNYGLASAIIEEFAIMVTHHGIDEIKTTHEAKEILDGIKNFHPKSRQHPNGRHLQNEVQNLQQDEQDSDTQDFYEEINRAKSAQMAPYVVPAEHRQVMEAFLAEQKRCQEEKLLVRQHLDHEKETRPTYTDEHGNVLVGELPIKLTPEEHEERIAHVLEGRDIADMQKAVMTPADQKEVDVRRHAWIQNARDKRLENY